MAKNFFSEKGSILFSLGKSFIEQAVKMLMHAVHRFTSLCDCTRSNLVSFTKMPPKRVFRKPKTSEEEKKAFDSCVPKSTQYATKWAFKTFSEWQLNRTNKDPSKEQRSFACDVDKIQTLDTNMCNMTIESLNFWLTKFVQEVAKPDGKRYPSRSIYLIITGLQRHLKESGNEVSLLGLQEKRLNVFRRALESEMREATQDGVCNETKWKDRGEITEEDEKTMWMKGLLGCSTAKSLMRTIYFYNGKLFGLRAKEHRNLKLSNFRIESDSVIYDESVSKTFHGGLKDLKYKPRCVKHICCHGKPVDHSPCMVKYYSLYLDKIKLLSEEFNAFYFRPSHKLDEFYFCRSPIGINTLNEILPNLCLEAGLERKTSHCLRITCASRLFQNSTEEKVIRERTGHRSNALLTYEKVSKEQECKASAAVGPPALLDNPQNTLDLSDMSDFQSLFDLDVPDDILANITEPTTPNNCAESSFSAPNALFQNCVFNFN